MSLFRSGLAALIALAPLAAAAQAPPPRPDQAAFRAIHQEPVETNTELSDGGCTAAAAKMGARLKSAGAGDAVYFGRINMPIHGVPGVFGDPDGDGVHGLNERLRALPPRGPRLPVRSGEDLRRRRLTRRR